MNPMLSNLDPAAVCRVFIHFNNGVPKIWLVVASVVSKTRAWRIWGSLKRGSLQSRESSWNELVTEVMPTKRAKGYLEISGQPSWFEVQQLVAAYRDGKPFLSIEGHRLGQVADNLVHNVCQDSNLQAALRKTRLASTGFNLAQGGQVKELAAVSPARVLGKDDLLNVTASTGRSYAW